MGDAKKVMTTADLIAELVRLDPEGTTPVALSASGGQVRPIDAIDLDSLHVSSNDPTFATRGRYHVEIMKTLCDVAKGTIVCID